MKPDETPHYWDSISRSFTQGIQYNLWRSHSDHVNISLLDEWLAGRHFVNILKTDLFDEAVSPGLHPVLLSYGTTIHGVDVAADAATEAGKKYPELNAICGDVRQLPLRAGTFDLVVSNSTLDHFQSTAEIESALRELFSSLKTGGELIVSLDNLQNPLISLRSILPYRLLNKLGLVPYFVGKSFGKRGLKNALEAAGFEVLDTRSIMHCPRVFAVAIAGFLQKHASIKTQMRFLAILSWFECLDSLPSKYFTGYFIAMHAIKPEEHSKS